MLRRSYRKIIAGFLAVLLVGWTGFVDANSPSAAENMGITASADKGTPEVTQLAKLPSSDAVIGDPEGSAELSEVPETSEVPEISETPEITEAPLLTEAPVITEAPVVTETPDVTEAPDISETPEITETPLITEEPAAVDVPEPTEEPVSAEPGYTFNKIVTNVKDNLNVRSGPGADYRLVGTMGPNAAADLIEFTEDGSWVKIRSGNITGYVKSEYVFTGEEALNRALALGKIYVLVNAGTVNIRGEKSTEAEIIRKATRGEKLTFVPELTDSRWIAVKLSDGRTAYLTSEWCEIVVNMSGIKAVN